MTKFTILSAGVILLTTLATPVLAMSFSPPSRSVAPGNETMTRPWSAPTGHRQPAVADIPASTSLSQQSLDPEDASVERAIRGVCRGC
ncbi:MAG: hypothetical protein WDN50_11090 [Bradyrhizobium sp.]